MDEKTLKKQIREHNEKVDYNRTTASWVIDIIACIIFLPIIIMVLYRRGRYNEYKKDFD